MATEEIVLNPALVAAGLEVTETDLGEYIVQIDGDRPSHIIAPIIHKTRGEVRESLSRVAGRELPDDASELTAFAREQPAGRVHGCGRRHQRRQLRHRGDGHRRAGDQRGQRAHVHRDAARAHLR